MRSDFCVVFTMGLCALESKQTLNTFAISSHTALKLATQSLRSFLKVTCEYELHILPENMKARPPLVRYLLRNRLLMRCLFDCGVYFKDRQDHLAHAVMIRISALSAYW